MLSNNNEDRYYFSHEYEICITSSVSFRDMVNDYYLRQRMPVCEIILIQTLAENPRLIYCLNRFSSNPYTRKNTN